MQALFQRGGAFACVLADGERIRAQATPALIAYLLVLSWGAVRVARRQLPISVLERHLEVVAGIEWPSVDRV